MKKLLLVLLLWVLPVRASYTVEVVDPGLASDLWWCAITDPAQGAGYQWTGYGFAGSMTFTIPWFFGANVRVHSYATTVGSGSGNTFAVNVNDGSSHRLTWTGTGLGFTYTLLGAGTPQPWKIKFPVQNNSLANEEVSYSMTDSLGNQYFGTFTLLPGDSELIEITLQVGATPGTMTISTTQLTPEGTVANVQSTTVASGDSRWQQTSGTPTTGSTTTAPKATQIPTDTTSQTTPGITYGTATGAASESSLKTGFGAVRTAIAETAAGTQDAVRQTAAGVASAVTAGAVTVAGEVSDASDLAHADSVLERGLLGEIRDEAERTADAAEGALATNVLAKTLIGDTVGTWGSQIGAKAAAGTGDITDTVATGTGRYASASSALSFSPAPGIWVFDLGPAGTFDLNPRQAWEFGSTANEIRIWCRAFLYLLLIGYGMYCAIPRAIEAMHDVAQAHQLQAPTGAEGLVSLVSIPSYVAVMLGLYVALSVAIMAAWTAFLGSADWSFAALVLPAVPAEIVSIADEWFPITEFWPLLCGYVVFRFTVGSAAGALAVARSFLPV